MKPIVLATDGSPSAAEATLHAVELAHELGAPLVAVSVEHISLPGYGYYGYGEIVAELHKIERDHVEGTLKQVLAVAGEHGVNCEIEHSTGPVADEICRIAKEHGAQMIVIGAHGWGPLRRILQGSVSTAVVHQAACPVLVVPGGPEVIAERAPVAELTAVR